MVKEVREGHRSIDWKGHEEAFWEDRNALCLDLAGGTEMLYLGVKSIQLYIL